MMLKLLSSVAIVTPVLLLAACSHQLSDDRITKVEKVLDETNKLLARADSYAAAGDYAIARETTLKVRLQLDDLEIEGKKLPEPPREDVLKYIELVRTYHGPEYFEMIKSWESYINSTKAYQTSGSDNALQKLIFTGEIYRSNMKAWKPKVEEAFRINSSIKDSMFRAKNISRAFINQIESDILVLEKDLQDLRRNFTITTIQSGNTTSPSRDVLTARTPVPAVREKTIIYDEKVTLNPGFYDNFPLNLIAGDTITVTVNSQTGDALDVLIMDSSNFQRYSKGATIFNYVKGELFVRQKTFEFIANASDTYYVVLDNTLDPPSGASSTKPTTLRIVIST